MPKHYHPIESLTEDRQDLLYVLVSQRQPYYDQPFKIHHVCSTVPDAFLSNACCEVFGVGSKVISGEMVWVVSVRHSLGDSFESSSGHGAIAWVFSNERQARQAVQDIEQQKTHASIQIQIGHNRVLSWANPASEYFDEIESVEIQAMTVHRAPPEGFSLDV